MVVAVASPSPAPPAATRPHPTYKEMILQALTELGGSSRRAVAEYIADRFSGLPARHDALLSVHLRRLRSQGLLVMSGYSYLLSSAPTAAQRRGRGRLPKKSAAALVPPPGEKRGPGRSRKSALPVPGRLPVSVSSSAQPTAKRGRGRPRKDATTADAPMLRLLLDVLPVKRRPGRPRKNAASGVKLVPGRPWRNATPVSVTPTAVLGAKRGRGRPPKNAPIMTATPGAKPGRPRKVAVSVASVPGKKGQPGRPRKSVVVSTGAVLGSSVVSASVAGVRRGRGRPPKAMLPAHSGIGAPAMPLLVPGKRKRGRTPKEKRRPGRPRKDKPLQPGPVLSVDAALSKRGPGRPRKEKTLEAGGVVVAEMTEAGPIEASGEAEAIQAVGEARCLQSRGASLMKKRGRGRLRKEKPSETEPAEIGVAASVEKRGRGRPRKEKSSVARSAETGDAASMGNKRGRGRPRKNRSFETGFVEAANLGSANL